MSYRGRLIYPFEIEIAQLDIDATAADPDGAGANTSGYDSIFRSPIVLPTNDGLGTIVRAENSIRVPAQFNSTDKFADLDQAPTGNLGKTSFSCLLHFRDLEELGYIEEDTGSATIKVGDRLVAIYDINTKALVQKVRNPPGCFVTAARPIFGLHNRRNLLEVIFENRDPGTQQ